MRASSESEVTAMTVALLDIQDAPSYANSTRILLVSGWQISHFLQKWGSKEEAARLATGSLGEICYEP
jgi:hypothetical protein